MPKDLHADLLSDSIINVIRKFMIFNQIAPDNLKKIFAINEEAQSSSRPGKVATIYKYQEGETVIQEGDFECWSFWVIKGIFDVIQDGKPVATLSSPGEIFGEMSVFEGIPRTATVVSVTDSICLCLDMSIIEQLKDEEIEAKIKEGFYSIILERLGSTKDHISTEKKRLEEKYTDLVDFETKIKSKIKKAP